MNKVTVKNYNYYINFSSNKIIQKSNPNKFIYKRVKNNIFHKRHITWKDNIKGMK